MKVYVTEQGVYHERSITGVYASLELAQADNPIPDNPRTRAYDGKGWRQVRDGEWDNGLDFAEAISIIEFEVAV